MWQNARGKVSVKALIEKEEEEKWYGGPEINAANHWVTETKKRLPTEKQKAFPTRKPSILGSKDEENKICSTSDLNKKKQVSLIPYLLNPFKTHFIQTRDEESKTILFSEEPSKKYGKIWVQSIPRTQILKTFVFFFNLSHLSFFFKAFHPFQRISTAWYLPK